MYYIFHKIDQLQYKNNLGEVEIICRCKPQPLLVRRRKEKQNSLLYRRKCVFLPARRFDSIFESSSVIIDTKYVIRYPLSPLHVFKFKSQE